MRTDPDVQRAVNSYQLGLPRVPLSGRSGELLGRGTGSSVEFQEYREYMPGDDIRHLDWAAYARTDTLMVRLYREEISPRTEILLDVSRSMASAAPGATGPSAKTIVARQLAAVFTLLSAGLGARPRITLLGDDDPIRSVGTDDLDVLTTWPFSATSTLADLIERNRIVLKRQSVRVVISDFLFPHDPEALIRRLAGDASTLWILQLLNEWEAAPTPIGGRRLIDLETEFESDVLINKAAVSEYSTRFARLQTSLARACRRAHAVLVPLIAERGLSTLCRDHLCAAGLLRT